MIKYIYIIHTGVGENMKKHKDNIFTNKEKEEDEMGERLKKNRKAWHG